MSALELELLKMWSEHGIEDIYKYKNKIKQFRGELTGIELFYDLTYQMFQSVEDIANHDNSSPEDFKMKVEQLIQKYEIKQ